MFDWKDNTIKPWRKLLRIVYTHGWTDIECRGWTSTEIALKLIQRHKNDLTPDELEYVQSVLR
jgi:hypothetical protein